MKKPILELSRDITFQAAHRLPRVPAGHKCSRVHGHTYRVRIVCRGAVRDDGFVIDNDVITQCLRHVHSRLDHQLLNSLDAEDFFTRNPTAENLAVWVWDIASGWPGIGAHYLARIEVLEGTHSRFVFEGAMAEYP